MRLTVTTLEDDIYNLVVSSDLHLEDFITYCHSETGYPKDEILINHSGRVLIDRKKSLKKHGICDGDILVVQHITGQHSQVFPLSSTLKPDFKVSSFFPGTSKETNISNYQDTVHCAQCPRQDVSKGFLSTFLHDPAHVRELLLSNPDQLSLLRQNNPRLADALDTGKLNIFAKVLKDQTLEREKRKKQKMKLMNSYPFDMKAQELIAEEIRQKNVDANMEAAMEYNPETFGSVVMLYINCKVNGVPVKAFVDSGAQTTIMSAKCAERCNIMRLIDTRWAGLAKGVGIQRIIGRIHMVQVAIETDFLTTSFSILEEQPMDMLLGLDMLRRHQCSIDLKRNVLKIGTTGTRTPFLPESELPPSANLMVNIDEDGEEEDEDDYDDEEE